MEQRPVSGVTMLLVTSVLAVLVLMLAILAGPFGRTPTIREQPGPYASASER
jgi:hypothetical protein